MYGTCEINIKNSEPAEAAYPCFQKNSVIKPSGPYSQCLSWFPLHEVTRIITLILPPPDGMPLH